MIVRGTVWKFGDNINTDEIIPARYLNCRDAQELAKHCMEDADTQFASHVKAGDIIVGGTNFGCGSSREHAPIAIKACGIALVIAKTFARIFFRNAVNIGLPILESPDFVESVHTGDAIEVNLDEGTITNKTQHNVYHAAKYPSFMQELIHAGGLMEWVKKTKKI